MNRIFRSLGLFSIFFLLATFALGLSLEAGDIRDATETALQRRASWHRLSGVIAGVLIILVDSVAVTYFIGTNRWVREVCETYGIQGDHTTRAAALKSAAFPWAAANMFLAIIIVALGGAADPVATLHLAPPAGIDWKWLHLTAAGVGVAAILLSFVKQLENMTENQAVIGRVMQDVRAVRQARGLDQA